MSNLTLNFKQEIGATIPVSFQFQDYTQQGSSGIFKVIVEMRNQATQNADPANSNLVMKGTVPLDYIAGQGLIGTAELPLAGYVTDRALVTDVPLWMFLTPIGFTLTTSVVVIANSRNGGLIPNNGILVYPPSNSHYEYTWALEIWRRSPYLTPPVTIDYISNIPSLSIINQTTATIQLQYGEGGTMLTPITTVNPNTSTTWEILPLPGQPLGNPVPLVMKANKAILCILPDNTQFNYSTPNQLVLCGYFNYFETVIFK